MKIIIDTETTGVNAKRDELLQISIISEEKKVLFNSYIKPQRAKCWDDAMAVNGISPEMVADAPEITDVRDYIQDIVDSADEVLGYNTVFDIRFLNAAGIMVDKPIIDAMRLLGKREDNGRWWKLEDIAVQMGFDYSKCKAHNSLTDCFVTLYVYNRIYHPVNKSIFTTKEDKDYFTGRKCDAVIYEIFRATEEEKEKSRKYGFYIFVSRQTFLELINPNKVPKNIGSSEYGEKLKAACQQIFETRKNRNEFVKIMGRSYI